MITREQIETRKDELVTSRANVLANLNAHNGAIEECDRLLAMMDAAPEPPKETPKK